MSLEEKDIKLGLDQAEWAERQINGSARMMRSLVEGLIAEIKCLNKEIEQLTAKKE